MSVTLIEPTSWLEHLLDVFNRCNMRLSKKEILSMYSNYLHVYFTTILAIVQNQPEEMEDEDDTPVETTPNDYGDFFRMQEENDEDEDTNDDD